ncbi:TPA: NAD-dependent epimerase/dehydratase family protein [Vibrio parahaemolyticus]|nr:NAD-dependent epimerase/dehydratase family protein [Vibrio parahaemolyticus]
MTKLLITGGSGFIGREFQSRVPDSRWVLRENSSSNVKDYFVIDELNERTDWTGAFEQIDTVIHLAAAAHSKNHSANYYDTVNYEGTMRLASEAVLAGVKRFVFISTIGVNGSSTKDFAFSKDSKAYPHNSYAYSKYKAECGLKRIAKESGLELVIVRPTLVYGPGAPGNFGTLVKFISLFRVLPFGLANNRRDFIAVQNLVDLLITCSSHPKAAGQIFLASDGETMCTKEFTNAIAEGLSKRVFQLPVPVSLMRLAGHLTGRAGVVEQLFGNLEVDSSNIKEELGWTPPLTMKQAMAKLRDFGVKGK